MLQNYLASDSWAIADLLRGDFKQSQYGRIILPFSLLQLIESKITPGELQKANELIVKSAEN